MICFPNAKINIGLFVTEKRADGYHNLETVFYPVGLADILEINRAKGNDGDCFFRNTGIAVDCPDDRNLVIRAYHLLSTDHRLPAVNIHLHKIIPFGAGLGGGSSDAAFALKMLNDCFELGLSAGTLAGYASRLGSDCAFFIADRPAFASGKGDLLEEMELSLDEYELVLVKPECGVSTPEAYSGIRAQPVGFDLRELGKLPVKEWKDYIVNDFEPTVFRRCPEIARIKAQLYESGAVYASMTGSGSAVFGLLGKGCRVDAAHYPKCFVWSSGGVNADILI